MRTLIFDIETNGLPTGRGVDPSRFGAYPLVLSLAFMVLEDWKELEFFQTVLNRTNELAPEDWNSYAEGVHGISWDWSKEAGINPVECFSRFRKEVEKSDCIIAHNLKAFDLPIVQSEYYRMKTVPPELSGKVLYDSMTDQKVIQYVGATRINGKLKWPKLNELYRKCFGEDIIGAHDAGADTKALSKSIRFLLKEKVIEF